MCQLRNSNCHCYKESPELFDWMLVIFYQHQNFSAVTKSRLWWGCLLTCSFHAQFDTARTFPRTISTTITKYLFTTTIPCGVAQSIKSTGVPSCTAHVVFVPVLVVARAIFAPRFCDIRFSHIDSIWIVTSRARQRPKYPEKEIGQQCEPQGVQVDLDHLEQPINQENSQDSQWEKS